MRGVPFGCAVETRRTAELQADLDELEGRFPGLAADFTIAEKVLNIDPFRGPVISASSSAQDSKHAALRKMEVKSKAAKRGKRTGFRLVYHVARSENVFRLYLLHLYFKGDKEDLKAADYTKLQAVLSKLGVG